MTQRDMIINSTGLVGHRPEDARLVADMSGRYFLKRWSNSNIKSAVYCRAQRISADTVTFVGLAGGDKGDHAHIAIEHFGRLSGRIQRAIGTVLMMKIEMPERDRLKLAAKIHYHQRKRVYGLGEPRRGARFKPANPNSMIVLESGMTVDCYVLDISVTGAAIASSCVPPVGTVLAIGRIVSKVVRHMDEGFAVQFVKPESAETLEARACCEDGITLL